MKRILTLIMVATLLFSTLSICAFAEESEEATRLACYRINWATQSYVTYDYSTKKNNPTNYELYYTVDKTARHIKTTGTTNYDGSGTGTNTRAQFSQNTFTINNSTHYEYLFKAKNNIEGEYAGIVFAFAGGLPYIMYGAFNNTGVSPNTGVSDIILTKGVHQSSSLSYTTGHKRSYLKLALDNEGYGHYKIVYNGYNVSVYGLIDSEKEIYRQMGDSIKLPNDAKVALGVYARVKNGGGVNRTVNLSDCLLYAMNTQAKQMISFYDDGTCRLSQLINEAKTNYSAADNTAATYRELMREVEAAENLLDKWDFTLSEISEAERNLDDALDQMEVNEADFTQLKATISSFEALNPKEYTEISYKMVETVVNEAKGLLTKDSVRQSRVNDTVTRILDRIEMLVPSGYKAPATDEVIGTESGSESGTDTDYSSVEKGCKSIVVGSSILGIGALVGVAAIVVKKKED